LGREIVDHELESAGTLFWSKIPYVGDEAGARSARNTDRRYRPRDPAATSRLMANVRGTDTRVERLLRSRLHQMGLRFRKNLTTVFGCPDIVFPAKRLAIFVDGDYWHGRILVDAGIEGLRSSLKTSNREFWVRKIQSNVERDYKVNGELERAGWRVLRFWETDVKRDPAGAIRSIIRVIQSLDEARSGERRDRTLIGSR
jgi:DNA mismatch endonuclease, patch repair protein